MADSLRSRLQPGHFPLWRPDELEEERRLFYVALTRTQCDLHLHLVQTELPSQFLAEADWKSTLADVQALTTVFACPPDRWRTAEALTALRLAHKLELGRYFGLWHSEAQSRAAGAQAHRLYAAACERGLDGPLGLTSAHLTPWGRFAPSPDSPSEAISNAFDDLAGHAPPPQKTDPVLPVPPKALRIGGRVQHSQHGLGIILAIRGDRLSPRLEIQFARGKPVVLPAKFIEPIAA